MGRPLFVLGLIAVLAAAGAAAYTAYATDRDYGRLVVAGDRAAGAQRPADAVAAYSGAIALRPDSMLAHLKRGMTYRAQGELEAAARDLHRAHDLDPTATQPLELLGDTYLAMHRADRAAERYQGYLALDDRSPRIWYKLALARYRHGETHAAIDAADRALALDAALAEAHLVRGLALRDGRRLTDARRALELAVRRSPALAAPREALAGVAADLGDHLRAIDQLEALAALDPGNPARLVALGEAHARARRHEAAVVALSRAVERFPDDPRVYAALGRVWLEMGLARNDRIAVTKAREALHTAAAYPAASSEALTDLARAHLFAGDVAAAEQALRTATVRTPVAPEAFRQLAAIAGNAGRPDEARAALLQYVALVADARPLAEVATDIARYSLALAQPELALTWIARAVEESGETAALRGLRQRAQALRR